MQTSYTSHKQVIVNDITLTKRFNNHCEAKFVKLLTYIYAIENFHIRRMHCKQKQLHLSRRPSRWSPVFSTVHYSKRRTEVLEVSYDKKKKKKWAVVT